MFEKAVPTSREEIIQRWFEVVAAKDHDEIKIFLDHIRHTVNADVINIADEHGYTALLHSVRNNDEKTVELLLAEKLLDTTLALEDGYGALELAIEKQHFIITDMLYRDGRALNDADVNGQTLFMKAVKNAKVALVDELLASKEIDINVVSPDGFSALMLAALNGHTELFRKLLSDKRLDLARSFYGKNGQTPLRLAIKNDFAEIVSAIFADNRFDVNTIRCEYFDRWPAGCDLPESRQAAESYTPLIMASKMGRKNVIKALLEVPGIQVSKVSDQPSSVQGCSPLICAVMSGCADAVRLLLAREDVDVNFKGIRGDNALMHAAFGDKSEGVYFLLHNDARIDVNVKDNDGRTALMYAAKSCHSLTTKVVEALLSRADVHINAIDKNGDTAANLARIYRTSFHSSAHLFANHARVENPSMVKLQFKVAQYAESKEAVTNRQAQQDLVASLRHLRDATEKAYNEDKKAGNLPKDAVSTAEELADSVSELISSLQDKHANKIEAIKCFEAKCKQMTGWQRFANVIARVCVAAVGFALGVTIGFTVGMLAGAWTGPGAFVTAAMGAVTGATMGVFTLGVASSTAASVAAQMLLFKPKGLQQEALKVAEKARASCKVG